MSVKITPAIIVNVICDNCGIAAPDVATIPIGLQLVRDKMEQEGWKFQDPVINVPGKKEPEVIAHCPKCADIKPRLASIN